MDTSWRLASQLAWRGKAHQEYLTKEGFFDTYGNWGLGEGGGGGMKWN
jgi:pyruvate decarboxylase